MAGARSLARCATCSSSRSLSGVPSARRRSSVMFDMAVASPSHANFLPNVRAAKPPPGTGRAAVRSPRAPAGEEGMAPRRAGSDAVAIDFEIPPLVTNHEGRMRGVGVELEFAGLAAADAAQALTAAFGGRLIEENPHAYAIEGSELGDLAVRLDLRYVHASRDDDSLLGRLEAKLTEWFGTAASLIVPCELITAPVRLDRLADLERAIEGLRRGGAARTQDRALHAFGLHFNPEAPRLNAETIVSVLKAFVLLDAWLRREVAPDPTRDFLGFADPFPADYVRRLAAPDYWPALDAFVDDYLDANPTRNRDLDLLPLLRFLDDARVTARLPDAKIGKRPAFHYRLPDARVSDPGWRMAPGLDRGGAL